jgi:SpoVK/Ycf46/Vps4 family AAA+-type ATPase
MIPENLYYYIENEIKEYFHNKRNESSITIPYHIKTYSTYGSSKTIDKTLYSDRFHALNYHIKKYHLHKLFSLTEIINFENSRYLEGDSDFILLPKNRQKIKINEEENIFFEILLEKRRDSENGEKDKEKESFTKMGKKYIYKISKNGKHSIQSLHLFLEKLEKEYLDEIVNKTTQMVFEYKKSVKDDEERQMTVFSETPFKTNKSFDNIFFEGKRDFIEYISRFSKGDSEKDKDKDKKKETEIKQYEHSGNPFKAVVLLHGDPGCGKSSLVKATIKYTGRHCVLVPWTKIKTCNDFVSLFRSIKINNKVYSQDELIIVFEDFDANENDIIKIRDGLKGKKSKRDVSDTDTDSSSDIHENIWKRKIDNLVNCQTIHQLKMEDELTLEYILNVLDGIVELYNVIVFFTTNDISVIDPALKRTGRIDRIVKMERATREIIREMICHRFSIPPKTLGKYAKKIEKIPEYKIACADISQICNDSNSLEECVERIITVGKK